VLSCFNLSFNITASAGTGFYISHNVVGNVWLSVTRSIGTAPVNKRLPERVQSTAPRDNKDGNLDRRVRKVSLIRVQVSMSAHCCRVRHQRHRQVGSWTHAAALHWLDVRDRVTFKLVVMARRCLNGCLSTSPFTVSHCPARNISIPVCEIYCT